MTLQVNVDSYCKHFHYIFMCKLSQMKSDKYTKKIHPDRSGGSPLKVSVMAECHQLLKIVRLSYLWCGSCHYPLRWHKEVITIDIIVRKFIMELLHKPRGKFTLRFFRPRVFARIFNKPVKTHALAYDFTGKELPLQGSNKKTPA